MRVLVSSADTNGRISIMEQWLPENWSTPTHVHQREDQTVHVLEGEIHARIGAAPATLKAGESAFLPRGIPHVLKAGPNGAKMLEINTPGGFEQFHVDVGEPATDACIPPPKASDIALLDAAIRRFDAQIVGPPMS
ncbi:MAG: cupin domain-containing protein [Pseudomonadota bacterium]